MCLQKANMTIEQEQELYMKEEEHPQTLERPKTILTKIEDLNVLTAIYMDIWQKNAGNQKKEQDIRKCYKYDKIEHIAKNCRLGKKMRSQSVQEELDNEKNNNQEGFVGGLKQAQYNKPLYKLVLIIDILF